jgi:serine/threonine protein kinase
MEAIIDDFGTALYRKLSEDSYSHSETRKMLSTMVVGTPGYIAPGNYFIDHTYYSFTHTFDR